MHHVRRGELPAIAAILPFLPSPVHAGMAEASGSIPVPCGNFRFHLTYSTGCMTVFECSRCKEPTRYRGYCRPCRADYMREWRARGGGQLSKEDRRRASARSTLNVAISRGKIRRGSCEVCGTLRDVEGHHEDYDFPLVVRWLCREHHRDLHSGKISLPRLTL